MQHLTEEQLVSFHYRDEDIPSASEHLASCPDCAAQYTTLRSVLALVSDAPIPERGERYGEEVWTRLRWKLERGARRRRWQSFLAVAAMLAIAFVAGHFWRAQRDADPAVAIATTTGGVVSPAARAGDEAGDKLLFIVVSDHLDTSGRMLLEVVNAAPDTSLSSQPRRAGELVAANRIYRQTAQHRGDERIAALLADLEPILLELANAGDSLEGKKLADIQKRIESKGLLFKVRIMSAPPPNVNTDSSDRGLI